MAATAAPAPQYQFGVFTADTRSGELRKSGVRIKLQDRPFEMLLALLERPGEVVTRDELRQRLWADGTFVDFDHSLSSAMNKLRTALSDSAANPRFIETVGRRGYRFIYPVTIAAVPAPSPPPETAPPLNAPSRRKLAIVAVSMIALVLAASATAFHFLRPASSASIRSVAVLPLKNLSNDAEQEYFSEGLTEEVIAKLGSLDGLRVISHTSVMQYANSKKTIPEIARELNVDAVMEGSVLRSGNRIRITAQLLEGPTERRIWAGNFEREQTDILALQNEVTREIAGKIKLSLNPADTKRLAVSHTLDLVAHENFLRGRYHWNKRTLPEFQVAIRYFQDAIAADPQYARAYAGLADCLAMMAGYSLSGQDEFIPKARAAALKALELDESLAEAHTSLAVIAQNYDWDWPTAEREYRRAIELDPNYATGHHWYAECLAYLGRFDEAIVEIDRAHQLDPLSLIIATDRAAILYYARQYDASIEQFRAVQAIDPSFPRSHLIVLPYVETGRFAEAVADMKGWDQDPRWADSNAAYVFGRAGDHAASERALRSLTRRYQEQPFDPAPLANACIAAGENDQAIRWLEKAFAMHSTAMTSLKVSPIYDPLRKDPRFNELLRRVGLPQ